MPKTTANLHEWILCVSSKLFERNFVYYNSLFKINLFYQAVPTQEIRTRFQSIIITINLAIETKVKI